MVRKLKGDLRRGGETKHDWDTLLDGNAYEVTAKEVGDLTAFRRSAYVTARRRGLSATVLVSGDKARIQAFEKV